MDEQFFFLYHLNTSRTDFLKYPINERKYLIHRFIEQKEKESEYMKKARNK